MQSLRWEFLFRWFIWGLFSKGHGGSKIGQREITTQEWGLSWTLASIRPHTKVLEGGSRLTFGPTLRQGAWFLESEVNQSLADIQQRCGRLEQPSQWRGTWGQFFGQKGSYALLKCKPQEERPGFKGGWVEHQVHQSQCYIPIWQVRVSELL